MTGDTISYIGTAFVLAVMAYPFMRLVNLASDVIRQI